MTWRAGWLDSRLRGNGGFRVGACPLIVGLPRPGADRVHVVIPARAGIQLSAYHDGPITADLGAAHGSLDPSAQEVRLKRRRC